MALSEAQKKARNAWDGENMSTLGCKVKKADALAFKEYAAKKGKTANTLLKEYVQECLKESEAQQ